MKVTTYDLWLGCDNGNRLTLKSNGGHNAIFMGSSSLYLAADLVCGTENVTTECVGVRKVAAADVSHFHHYNTLTLYGGTISGFYYGVLDVTNDTS